MPNILDIFNAEIASIENQTIQFLLQSVLLKFEGNFYDIPSSSSGKYHPQDENSKFGFIRHCKRVFWWVIELSKEHDLDTETRDAMIFAAVLHDLGRTRYLHRWGGYEEKEGHGLSGRVMIQKCIDEIKTPSDIKKDLDKNRSVIDKAVNMVESHMHHWEKDPKTRKPEELYEFIFATADYCASRREINTPVVNNKILMEMETVGNGK